MSHAVISLPVRLDEALLLVSRTEGSPILSESSCADAPSPYDNAQLRLVPAPAKSADVLRLVESIRKAIIREWSLVLVFGCDLAKRTGTNRLAAPLTSSDHYIECILRWQRKGYISNPDTVSSITVK